MSAIKLLGYWVCGDIGAVGVVGRSVRSCLSAAVAVGASKRGSMIASHSEGIAWDTVSLRPYSFMAPHWSAWRGVASL